MKFTVIVSFGSKMPAICCEEVDEPRAGKIVRTALAFAKATGRDVSIDVETVDEVEDEE